MFPALTAASEASEPRNIALSKALNATHGHLGVHLAFVVFRGLGIPAMKVAKSLRILAFCCRLAL